MSEGEAALVALPPHLFEPWSTVVYTVFRYEEGVGWWARYCDRPTLDGAQYEAEQQQDSGYETLVTSQRVTYGRRSVLSRLPKPAKARTTEGNEHG